MYTQDSFKKSFKLIIFIFLLISIILSSFVIFFKNSKGELILKTHANEINYIDPIGDIWFETCSKDVRTIGGWAKNNNSGSATEFFVEYFDVNNPNAGWYKGPGGATDAAGNFGLAIYNYQGYPPKDENGNFLNNCPTDATTCKPLRGDGTKKVRLKVRESADSSTYVDINKQTSFTCGTYTPDQCDETVIAGSLDAISCTQFAGYARDGANPINKGDLKITVGGTNIISDASEISQFNRWDLLSGYTTCNPINTGYHYSLNNLTVDKYKQFLDINTNLNITVSVRNKVIGSNAFNFFQCAYPKGEATNSITECKIEGWTCDESNNNTSLNLEIFEGGNSIGTTTANTSGTALTECGGTSNHYFSFPIPAGLSDGTNLQDGTERTYKVISKGINADNHEDGKNITLENVKMTCDCNLSISIDERIKQDGSPDSVHDKMTRISAAAPLTLAWEVTKN